ncbi:MAG TPA: Gfo/Idh/MocA family oxidoreductase [Armatimonadetes bacterium]|nr:Gfo/Idh/MocA family oxidoreductase [Armatimonadota bacterium]
MSTVEPLGVGLIGAGFAANIHAQAYQRVQGVPVRVVAVAARREESVRRFAEKYDIPYATTDWQEILAREDVQLVDLCVPVYLHAEMAIAAAQAGKHVACEKPLTGYCGEGQEGELLGQTVPKRKMYQQAVAQAEAMVQAAQEHGVQLMYAENWIYAPAIAKARRLIKAAGGTILDLRAEESHSGSHSPYSLQWRTSGGGSLMRLGSHPLGAVLHLKRYEGQLRDGHPIVPVAVTAEVAHLTRIESFQREAKKWLVTGWQDVEDWASCIVTFSDGSRALITAADTVLGGIQNRLEVYLSNARINCHLNPNNACEAYAPEGEVFGEEYLAEKLETKAGRSYPSIDEDFLSGYPQEIQDFVEAAVGNRPALSDGELGREVVQVIYAAYRSAEEGQRVYLRGQE